MGTRSLTFVYDNNNRKIMNMYRQMDGYPTGHGRELAEFLNSFDEIVSGYSFDDPRKVANGMGCLAAQLVSEFKDGVGHFYLYPPSSTDCGQDYEYHVYKDKVKIRETGWGDIKTKTIFDGTWVEFLAYCQLQVE